MTAVIYLWAPDEVAADRSFGELAKRCEDYAYRFCWEVVETVRGIGGKDVLDPQNPDNGLGRPGLDRVFALLEDKRVVIVLVPEAWMFGEAVPMFNAVSEQVEKHGFVQLVEQSPLSAADKIKDV